MIPEAPHAFHTMTVRPWSYYFDVDEDPGEVRKIQHFVIHEDTGETKRIDWTPYEYMTTADLQRMVSLGFPKRVGGHPWCSDDLELHWWRQIGPVLLTRQHAADVDAEILRRFEAECG